MWVFILRLKLPSGSWSNYVIIDNTSHPSSSRHSAAPALLGSFSEKALLLRIWIFGRRRYVAVDRLGEGGLEPGELVQVGLRGGGGGGGGCSGGGLFMLLLL